jgi:ABC-2 type transport system permease protein
MLDAAEQLRVARVLAEVAEGRSMVRRREVRGAIVIPAGFERRVLRGERAVVGVHADASYILQYSQISTGASQAIGTLSAGIELRRLQASGLGPAAARRARDPLPVAVRALWNPSGGFGNANVPAVLVLILQQTMLIGIGTLAGARREAHDRAPGSSARLVGRALVYVGIYAAHVVLLFGIAYGAYGLPHRASVWRALLVLAPFLLATAMMGLAISRLFRDRVAAIQALVFTSLPAIFVSGYSFPAEAMPPWLRALARLLPSTHAIPAAVRAVQMGASLAELREPWLALWGLALAYGVGAWLAARDPRRLLRRRASALSAASSRTG